jgi:hypothetical protein
MCPAEIFVVKEKFFSAKVSVKTRQLLLAANRYWQVKKNH